MIILPYRFQTLREYSLSVSYILKNETTHNQKDIMSILSIILFITLCQNCPIDFKLGMMIPNENRYNVESVATQ